MKKNELIKKYREYKQLIESYYMALSLWNYDNTTIAPKKSLIEKSKYQSLLSMEVYKIITSPDYIETVDGLFEIKDTLPNDLKRAIFLEKRNMEHLKSIPSELYQEYSELANVSYSKWLEAKEKSDFSIFAPSFKRVIEIQKEFAKCYGLINNNVYDTLLNEYEEGMNTKILDDFFNNLKKRIVPLLNKIEKSKVKIRDDFASAKVNHQKQMDIAKFSLKQIGFDFSRGVVGETEHPFTSGISYNDVRVTTHIYENMFFSNIFSIVHEGGHALYDMNLDKKLEDNYLRYGTSMAIHESQSRLYENVFGRSREFISRIYKKIIQKLPSEYKNVTEEEMYLCANKVERSLVRTEADELTYSLHIMIRYELEKKMLNEDVDVYELPKLWNELYKEYLGIDVPNDKLGILQDSHWSDGAFGYFPSYALGNAYGIQFLRTMEKELDVFSLIKDGKIKEVNNWLKKNVYTYGGRVTPSELIELVTKEKFNPNYYLDYLENKFKDIYNIK